MAGTCCGKKSHQHFVPVRPRLRKYTIATACSSVSVFYPKKMEWKANRMEMCTQFSYSVDMINWNNWVLFMHQSSWPIVCSHPLLFPCPHSFSLFAVVMMSDTSSYQLRLFSFGNQFCNGKESEPGNRVVCCWWSWEVVIFSCLTIQTEMCITYYCVMVTQCYTVCHTHTLVPDKQTIIANCQYFEVVQISNSVLLLDERWEAWIEVVRKLADLSPSIPSPRRRVDHLSCKPDWFN